MKEREPIRWLPLSDGRGSDEFMPRRYGNGKAVAVALLDLASCAFAFLAGATGRSLTVADRITSHLRKQ